MNERTSSELQSYTLNKAFFIYGVKKAERLVRAAYLITNFFSDSEPLKWKLRNENLTLLEDFSRLSGSSEQPASVDLSFLENQLVSILASFGVAYTAGLISEMNYSIVRNEYEELLATLRGELDEDKKHTPLAFPKEFFNVGEQGESSERLLFGTSYGRWAGAPWQGGQIEAPQGREPAAPERAPKANVQKDKRTVTDTVKKTETKRTQNNRREIVVTLIKDKKEVSVKDIAREIQDVSEKTLQRELNKLVKGNVVEKIGKKRWSRYRLRV